MTRVAEILERLEAFYGPQEPCWPTDPYLFSLWWHCGYPASDAVCGRGWESLIRSFGVQPHEILAANAKRLGKAVAPAGMFPELRALRLKEIAERVVNEFGGDLRSGLGGPLPQVRKALRKFPGIADPGADRIILFAGIAPIAAVPSNCAHVLFRILRGREGGNYGATYRAVQDEIASGIAANFDARTRAYLLLKRHGQETCKHAKPRCDACPVNASCAFVKA